MASNLYLSVKDKNGKTYTGASQATGHIGKIEITDWDTGFKQTMEGAKQTTAQGKPASQPDSFSFSKYYDTSSDDFMEACLTGVELTECILQMFRPIGNVDLSKSGQYFLQITLSKAYASKYELKGESGDDLPTEDIEIVYEKLLFEYKEFDSATSVMGSPLKAGWDWDLKAAAS